MYFNTRYKALYLNILVYFLWFHCLEIRKILPKIAGLFISSGLSTKPPLPFFPPQLVRQAQSKPKH